MGTQVLLSFSYANMASIFSMWLRRRIMRAKDLYDPKAVYMDNVALRDEKGTQLTQDTRFREANEGITLIGAMNDDWNVHYQKAMAECSSMIAVATREWSESKWCAKELNQSDSQARGRTKLGGSFNRVALVFPETDGDTRSRFSAGGWNLIPTDKLVVGGSGANGDYAEVAAHAGGWVIPENDLQRVISAI